MRRSIVRKLLLTLGLAVVWAAGEPLRGFGCEYGPGWGMFTCSVTEEGTCDGFSADQACPGICYSEMQLGYVPNSGACYEDGGNRVISCGCAQV
jgi:hypothetical protein